MADPDNPRFAHFENVKETSLYHLYSRHAEVARDIHQDALRTFTGNNELTVELVAESPIIPDSTEKTIDRLQDYEVVSVSSGVGIGAIIYGSGISNADTIREYRTGFAEEDMPVYVVAAGNEGRSNQVAMPRVADFARNSLVVGEANLSEGQPFVEGHSSKLNPTLSADSPFNRGEKYQFYDTSPSLEGHEELIRKWVIENEIDTGFKLFEEHNKDSNLTEDQLGEAYQGIRQAKYKLYTESEEGRAWVERQVQAYMEDPDSLHTKVMTKLRENNQIDENGYTSDIDGTSFSAPEQAGYISGAIYEQSVREDKGLPILTKDEITTLAKMATIDTTAREDVSDPMPSYTNPDGHTFVSGGGHGIFRPEIFRALVDESYNRIETNPDINRESVTATLNTEIGENHNGSRPINLESNLPEGSKMVIDRVRLDIDYDIDGTLPHHVELKPNGEEFGFTRLQEASSMSHITSWARMEGFFGETHAAGNEWEVKLINGEDATVTHAQVTMFGYAEGGLMDQMMDYSKDLAAKMSPAPETAPETAPAIDNETATPAPIAPGGMNR